MVDYNVTALLHHRQQSAGGGERAYQNSNDDEIIGGVILSNPIVSGVPDRSEIFRLALLADRTADITTDPLLGDEKWLRVLNPVQLQLPEFAATAPAGQRARAVDETAVCVLMQVASCDIALCRIRVIESKVTDDGREVVFEGTEVRRTSRDCTRRDLKVTVYANGFAAHEVIAETHYPA